MVTKTLNQTIVLSALVMTLGFSAIAAKAGAKPVTSNTLHMSAPLGPGWIPIAAVPGNAYLGAFDSTSVTLTGDSAATEDTVVTLTASNGALSLPQTVTIPAGNVTGSFTISTGWSVFPGTTTITATANGQSVSCNVYGGF